MLRRIYIGIVVLLLVVIAYLGNQLMRTRSVVNDGKVWSTLYQQQAAEYRALCYQAYNIAKERVDHAIKMHTDTPYAVITDIDETLLDNSRYDGLRAAEDSDFRQSDWKNWTAKGIADTVPGAAAFFKYAASKGVAVFYITNRSLAERAGTLRNLMRYNLPDTANLILQTDKNSSKEGRRNIIMHGKHPYKVILLCGDNLPDFDKAYDNKPSLAQRKAATDKLERLFGDRYIIIPNPEYNDWEGALYGFKYNAPDKDKIVVGMLNVDTSAKAR